MACLSFLAVLAGAFGVAGAHFRWLAPPLSFYLILGALALLALHLPVSLLRFIRRGRRDVSFPALLIGLLATGALGFLLKLAIENPVTDVTNHLAAPPVFRHPTTTIPAPGMAEFLDSSFHLNKDYNPAFAEKQKRAYLGIHPLFIGTTPEAAFPLVKSAVAKHPEWKIVLSDDKTLTLEMEEELPFLHSVDDFVVQVTPTGDGAFVLMRSRSRFGFTDFGFNAKRVRTLTSELIELGKALVPPLKVEMR